MKSPLIPQEPFGLPNDSVGAIGTINLQNFGAPGPSVFDQWTYTYRDVATRIIGNHSIKFGGELTRLYYLNEAPYSARPNFNFFNIWDFLNDAPQSESGTFDPTIRYSYRGRQDNREDIWGVFVQDDWKVKPALTLNVGLRYNYFGPLSSKEGQHVHGSVRQRFGHADRDEHPKGRRLVECAEVEFRPAGQVSRGRLAFYHQKVVIRGGYGLNYNQNEIAITANVNGNPGLTVSPNFTMNQPTSPNPGIVYQIPSDAHSLFGYPPNPNTIV